MQIISKSRKLLQKPADGSYYISTHGLPIYKKRGLNCFPDVVGEHLLIYR